LVVIAVEMLQPKGFGRIRIQRIERGDHDNLMPFIKTFIRSGSIIHSDGSPAYLKLKDNGYEHRQSAGAEVRSRLMPAQGTVATG
jgi:hypothetical protein